MSLSAGKSIMSIGLKVALFFSAKVPQRFSGLELSTHGQAQFLLASLGNIAPNFEGSADLPN